MEEAKPIVADPAQQEGDKDGKPDEVLAVLNATLKRDFKTREEAVKSVDNLHRMVGDSAVAELREKAKDADLFVKMVEKYASDEGVSKEEARKTFLETIMDTQPDKKDEKPVVTSEKTNASITEARLEAALVKLQEKDLLEAYPEAKLVINDLKALRAVQPDKELKDIYEASSLKDMAQKAVAYEKEKTAKDTTAVESKSRQVDLNADNLKVLAQAAMNSGMESDKVKLVDAYFKAQQ